MWNGNSHRSYSTSYNGWPNDWYSYPSSVLRNERPRAASRAERRMRSALAREELSKLEQRLRREAASRKAMSDIASRKRGAPATGAAPAHRNLQTYDDAMAARMAARRVA